MRLSVSKSKNRTFYYVIESHRVNGKNVTSKVGKIGEHGEMLAKGIEDPFAYAQEKVAEMNRDRKENKLHFSGVYDFTERLDGGDSACSSSTAMNVGWLYIHDIYKRLGLFDFLESVRGKARYDLPAVVEYLVANRFLFPGSKRNALLSKGRVFNGPDYLKDSGYRCLTLLDRYNDRLQAHLFGRTKEIVGLDTDVLYYDCTNFYFEIEDQDENELDGNGDIIQWGLRRYGASKEHRPNPIVQMGLFTDRNAIPISYCIRHGSNNEQNTVIPLEKRMIEDYPASRFIYCSDGGLGSYENRFFNSIQGRDYVVTQSLKKTPEGELELIFKDLNWRFVDNDEKASLGRFVSILDRKIDGGELSPEEEATIQRDMIYKEYPMDREMPPQLLAKLKLKGKVTRGETIFVTFSAKYYLYQRRLLEKQVQAAAGWLARDPDTLRKGPNDIRRLISTVSTTESGEVADTKVNTIDQGQVDRERRFHGFYAVATSLETDVRHILSINSSRWQIEQSFRILKSEFDSRPVYASTPEHIRGHFAICYISILIYRIMEKMIRDKTKESLTASNILATLKNMNVVPVANGNVYQSIYTNSRALKALEDVFGYSLDRKYFNPKKLLRKFE